MKESPCFASLKTPTQIVTTKLGGPIEARIRKGVQDIKPPVKGASYVKGLGLLGLFKQEREGGGNDYWLVVAWGSGDKPETTVHDQMIQSCGDNPAGCRWIGTVRLTMLFEHDTCRILVAHLTKKTLDPLWAVVGGPEGDGEWLASLILPRRIPGAIRSFEGGYYHLWLKL